MSCRRGAVLARPVRAGPCAFQRRPGSGDEAKGEEGALGQRG